MNKTIYDIAREINMSPATVSRALNNSGYVSDSTKALVMNAAEGYTFRKKTAHPTIRVASKTIGLLLAHDSSYFFNSSAYVSIMQGISEIAKLQHYNLLLSIDTNEASSIELYDRGKVDGFILLGIRKSSSLIPCLQSRNIPFVLIGDVLPNLYTTSFCTVDIDDFAAAKEATDYLITLGHKSIAYISGSFEYASCYYRYLGYKSALEEAGIPCDSKYVATSAYVTEENTINLFKRVLYQSPRPTAVVSFNDAVSIAVYKAIKECGYSIPNDISVIGFDDSAFAKYVTPPLTVVWQPCVEKGKRAATALIGSLSNGILAKEKIVLSSVLLYRESCSPPSL